MLTVTMVISLICGVILCFFGFRLFRFAMSLAGFIIGVGIGYFIYSLAAGSLPDEGGGFWVLVFMGAGGILLGILSYSIYKAALFYISMLVTAFVILKTFLMTVGSGMGLTTFFMVLIGNTRIGGVADSITDIPIGGNGTVGTAVANALLRLPGSTQSEKFWIVVAIAIALGIIAGIVVCLLQKPAIIVITSLFGGILITQSVFSLIGSAGTFDISAGTIVKAFSEGNSQPAFTILVAVAFIIVGIIVQFGTVKKNRRRKTSK